MTTRVPLVCTPEELDELLFWSGEVAIELYRLRIGGDNHDAANHAKVRRDAALAALFRPAEEPTTKRRREWTETDSAELATVLGDYIVTLMAGINDPGRLTRTLTELFATANGAGEMGESSRELAAIGRVGGGQATTATSTDRTIPPAPALAAPPPAEEREDLPAAEESYWAPVLVESRTPETESVMIHHAHRGQACVACELALLRSELSASQREVERLRAMLPPPAGGTAG